MNWPHAAPPFHAGEQALQARLGLRERMHAAGRTVMRTAMPAQHRELFHKLPFVVLGLLDGAGRPWATLAAGAPGFITTPDAETIAVAAAPLGADPAGLQWDAGAPVGMLGIEPSTRRRNRANGSVLRRHGDGFAFRIAQCFGNCPQYIQSRDFSLRAPAPAVAPLPFGSLLPELAQTLVAQADTFFIATASPDAGNHGSAPNGGLDASHRGGRPGFVRHSAREGGSRLTVPDYAGNKFFNTLGNIALRPQAGLCFADWATGDLLLLTGAAHVDWNDRSLAEHPGAERLLVVDVRAGWWLPGALPWRSTGPAGLAPQLERLPAPRAAQQA